MTQLSSDKREQAASSSPGANAGDIFQAAGMGLLTCAFASGVGASLTHGKPEAGLIALAGAAITAIPTIRALHRIEQAQQGVPVPSSEEA